MNSPILERGFLLPSFGLYASIAAAVVLVGALGYARVQTVRLEAANKLVEAFKQAGEIALAHAKQVDAENKAKKEKSDADYKRTTVALQRDNKRLRDSANTSSLPRPDPASPSPNRIAFDRAELDAATIRLTTGMAAIATEGAEAVNALDNAKAWAKNQ